MNRLIAECRENGLVAERLFGEKELLYSKQKPGDGAVERLEEEKNVIV